MEHLYSNCEIKFKNSWDLLDFHTKLEICLNNPDIFSFYRKIMGLEKDYQKIKIRPEVYPFAGQNPQ